MAESQLRIHLLGEFFLALGDAPVTTIDSARLKTLFTYLVLHHQVPQPRQHIAFLLWPDSTESQARTNLRNLLHQLRHALPEAGQFLRIETNSVQWQPTIHWTLDVAEFESAAANGDLPSAIDLYRGELLPGCYDEWLLAERERLHQLFLSALEKRLGQLETNRDYPAAILCAQRLLRSDPIREESYRNLIRLHALNGDRAAALHAYHTCATTLRRELEVEPSPPTRALYEQLLNAAQADTPLPSTPTIPLVGRQIEWKGLLANWQAACAGQPRMVVVSGEAGIGKTRLAEELLNWAARQGVVTAIAHCFQAEGALPFAPLTAWLRSRPLPELEEPWLVEVTRLLPEARAARPQLPPAPPMTEAWQRQRFFEALARAANHHTQPMLWVLEDAQWCDRDSLEWLHYFLRFQPASRVLILATERAEEQATGQPLENLRASLRRNGQLIEVGLTPLTEAETFALAEHTSGRKLDPALAGALYAGSEGNPLFVIEMVRAGLDNPESWVARPGQALLEAPLPPKVRAVIEARIAQLSPATHELAQVAAVIGREITYEVLRHASGASEEQLVRALDELWQRRIVREQGAESYDFTHAKLRDTAYATLSAARRRLLHRKVAEALETLNAHNLDGASGQIAAHYEQAGIKDQAVTYYRRAASAAYHIFANKEALGLYRNALQLTDDAQIQVELKEGLADVLQRMGQRDEGRATYRQALALISDAKYVDKARLCRKLAHSWWPEHGHQDEISQYFAQAIELLEGARPQADAAWQNEYIELALGRMWMGYWYFAPNSELEAIHQDIQPLVEQSATFAQRSRFYRSILLIQLKLYRWYMPPDETIRYGEMAIEAAQKGKDLAAEAWGYGQLGFIYLWRNELEPARYWLLKGIPLDEQLGYAEALIIALTYLTLTCRKMNDLAQVKIHGEKALAVATSGNMPIYIGQAKANLGWLAWKEGRLEEAQALEAEAVKLIPAVFPMTWVARWPLALFAHLQGRPAETIEHFRVMIAAHQHRLPDVLTIAMENAIRAWDANDAEAAQTALALAMKLAEQFLYL